MKILIIIDITIFVDHDNLIYVIFFLYVCLLNKELPKVLYRFYNIFKSRQIELFTGIGLISLFFFFISHVKSFT